MNQNEWIHFSRFRQETTDCTINSPSLPPSLSLSISLSLSLSLPPYRFHLITASLLSVTQSQPPLSLSVSHPLSLCDKSYQIKITVIGISLRY